jgi:hypothetical protein
LVGPKVKAVGFTCEKWRWPWRSVYNIRAAGSPLASEGSARPSAKKSASNDTSAGCTTAAAAVEVVIDDVDDNLLAGTDARGSDAPAPVVVVVVVLEEGVSKRSE